MPPSTLTTPVVCALFCLTLIGGGVSGADSTGPRAAQDHHEGENVQRTASQPGASVFTLRPDDPAAVHLSAPEFPVRGDGVADDTPALQQAIDRVGGAGIVLVPEGTYRLADTVRLWRGVRLIGYGKRRPTFLLDANTPGFQDAQSKYLIWFCGDQPKKEEDPIPDAWNTTFFSGVNNINVEIRSGNPAAVACRYFVAQLCSLENMDFHLSDAKAAVEQAGNEIADCQFFGGRVAVATFGTSAGWQLLVTDCHFEGQREAAFRTTGSGLTVIRCGFRRMPRVFVPLNGVGEPWLPCRDKKEVGTPENDRVEQVFIKDSRIEEVSDCAFRMAEPENPEHRLNVQNVACRQTPVFLSFGDPASELRFAEPMYRVSDLSHGLHVEFPAAKAAVKPRKQDAARASVASLEVAYELLREWPEMPPKDFVALPPQETWVSARRFGAVGDGKTDDTAALQKAVASHRAVYLPMGRYRLTDTLVLKPDTCLIGLHGQRPRLALADADRTTAELGDRAIFNDPAAPRPMLLTPSGGQNIVTGLGFSPGRNRGVVTVKWLAGEGSLLDDIWFGRSNRWSPRRGKETVCGLWVADGGGGTFRNFWTTHYAEEVGLRVTDTATPGRVYLGSVEHHLGREVELRNVANWRFYALQTEEDKGAEQTTAIVMEDCADLEFANLIHYRVMSVSAPHPHAIRMTGCRRIMFRGARCFSWGPHRFQNLLHETDSGLSVPDVEIGRLVVRPKSN